MKDDWRGEKGEYYDYGFEDGYKKAIEEFNKKVEKLMNIIKNNTNSEFQEYNEMLLNDIKELFDSEKQQEQNK